MLSIFSASIKRPFIDVSVLFNHTDAVLPPQLWILGCAVFLPAILLGILALSVHTKERTARLAIFWWLATLVGEFLLNNCQVDSFWRMAEPCLYIQYRWRSLVFVSMRSAILLGYSLDGVLKSERKNRTLRTLYIVVLAQIFISSLLSVYMLANFRTGVTKLQQRITLEKEPDKFELLKHAANYLTILRQSKSFPEAPEYVPKMTLFIPISERA